jgi:hypothetical protein
MTVTEKMPRLITWIGYLAITLLVSIPLAVLMVRSGAWQQGLLLYALSCLGSLLTLLAALTLWVLPRYAQWRGNIVTRALFAIPGTLLVLAMLGGRGDYPPIHDITTDTQDPPVFSAALKQRGQGSNSLEVLEDTLQAQRVAYPDLATLVTGQAIEKAFARATTTARQLGWEIYKEDLNGGIIEAVDTTAIMGFKDDVIIRLRTNADGTLVDLRSASRVGVSDLGANAARIREFISAFKQQD